MQVKTKQFNQGAAVAMRNPTIQKNLLDLYHGFHSARLKASAATPDWEALQDRARAIKEHTVENLDHYLALIEENVTKAGGKVYFADDDVAANKYVVDLAKARGVKTVIKSKSMVSEEMGLNHHFEDAGIESVETDLGEYIIQLAGETPFHIVAPAIHKSRQDVSQLFHEKLGSMPSEDITELGREARRQLRQKFIQADMGITGANFIVAETGTVVLVTNEGNGRMSTSMPKLHVAITGMEKVVPSMDDLGTFLRLLIRSATGQRLTSYVTAVTGPRREHEVDGPEEFHLVIVDNGRSKLLANPELRESLYCIRCGACLNACPVYRKVGGHAYGWVYPGPIGAIVSPVLTGIGNAKDLPFASSLCGACKEACPVRINIPRMLLVLRRELTEGTTYPDQKRVSLFERIAFRMWRIGFQNPALLRIGTAVGRIAQIPFARNGRIKNAPFLSKWTRYRTLPALPKSSFRDRWRKLSNEK
ncbi:MAG: LutB/LldF family L-lactate oxidation iron-sulfur protein [Chloroflexi bacterium]|nr:LutB/LldF family L-lactate oxidation iron-sulfur protein [Chloroflexota bacterium]